MDSAAPLTEALEDIRKARVAAQTTHENQAGRDQGQMDSAATREVESSHEQHITVALANASGSLNLVADSDIPMQKYVAIARRKLSAHVVRA